MPVYKYKKRLISPTAKACHDFETTGNSWLLFVWKKQDWSFNKKPCEKTFYYRSSSWLTFAMKVT